MMGFKNFKIIGIAILVFAAFGIIPFAYAQVSGRPQIVITWHASHSYIPADYSGKVLPNQASSITASVEVFDANGNRSNLSNVNVYWYLNDVLLGGGSGVITNTFNLFGTAPAVETLRVETPNYPGGLLIATTQIPMVMPGVVIEAPYANNTFSANPLTLTALPYFFDITSADQLGYTWLVNGQIATNAESPKYLQATLGAGTRSGSTVNVALNVNNSIDGTSAGDQRILTYQALP